MMSISNQNLKYFDRSNREFSKFVFDVVETILKVSARLLSTHLRSKYFPTENTTCAKQPLLLNNFLICLQNVFLSLLCFSPSLDSSSSLSNNC